MGTYERSGLCSPEHHEDYDCLRFDKNECVGITECVEAASGTAVPWGTTGPTIDRPVYRVTIKVEAERLSDAEAEAWWLAQGEQHPPEFVLSPETQAIVARVLKARGEPSA